MIRINPIKFSLSEEGWNKPPQIPSLTITITPNSDHQDIMSIEYSYTDFSTVSNGKIPSDLIESITNQIYQCNQGDLWDENSQP